MILIKNATLINEDRRYKASVLVEGETILEIIEGEQLPHADEVVDAAGLWLLPGVIDDQVHFREPGLTHKADIHTESRAAAAGGVQQRNVTGAVAVPGSQVEEQVQNIFSLAPVANDEIEG